MDVEIPFPLETVVTGVPASLQTKRKAALDRWKGRVRDELRQVLPDGHFATERPIVVKIVYFPDAKRQGDLDNILKPILDALCRFVYVDDKQVETIHLQRLEPDRIGVLLAPSLRLKEAADMSGPRT